MQNIRLSARDLSAVRSVAPLAGTVRHIIAVVIAFIAAAHFALFGYFLFRTAITSPISDMFAYIAAYLRFRAGEISLLDYLWQPHGEHHLVWIRLLTWADVEIFHTRGLPFMAAATTVVSAAALLVWQQLRRADSSLGIESCLGLLAPMLILSTANVTDCSVPINTTYPFTVFFAVLALVLFAGARGAASNALRIAALTAAFGASLGTAVGLLTWPILLWIAWRERLSGRWLAIIAGLGLFYCIFYARDVDFFGLAPALQGDAASFISFGHLAKLSDYFFAFLGLPLTRDPTFGLIGRAAGLVLFLAGAAAVLIATSSNRLRTSLDRIAVGMILLSFGSAVLASLGRGDLIDEVEVPVRYTMFTTPLQVALLCLVLPRVARDCVSSRARLLTSALGLALAVTLLTQQLFVGRAAAQIASAISVDADCFAEGGGIGAAVSPIVTRTPEKAQAVLSSLRQEGLLAPKSTHCAAR
jgi:hypothetical protein